MSIPFKQASTAFQSSAKALSAIEKAGKTAEKVGGYVATGAAIGSAVPIIGTGIGAGVGAVAGGFDAVMDWVSDIDSPSKSTLRKMKKDVETVTQNAVSAIDRQFTGSHSLRVAFGDTLKDGKKTFDTWKEGVFAFPVKYEEGLLDVFGKFGVTTNGRIEKGDTITLIVQKNQEGLKRGLELANYMYQNAKNKANWFAVKMSIEKNIQTPQKKKSMVETEAKTVLAPVKLEPVKIEKIKIDLKIPFWKKPIFWGVVGAVTVFTGAIIVFKNKKKRRK